MELKEYEVKALRTIKKDKPMALLMESCLGLSGEVGEVIDIIKKHTFQGHKLDTEHLKEEIGDVMWYINLLTHTLNINLRDVLDANIKKLENRFPNGFEVEKSVNRKG